MRFVVCSLLLIFNLPFAGVAFAVNDRELIRSTEDLKARINDQPSLRATEVPELGQMAQLFGSSDVKVLRHNDKVFREAIDLQFDALFQTPIGQKVCSVVMGVPENLERFFGLSASYASRLASSCELPSMPPRHETQGRRRSYLLVLHSVSDLPIDSWTTKESLTIVFFSPGEMTALNLAKRLVHELQIHLDLNVGGNDLWFAHNFVDKATLVGSTCSFLKALQHPVVRYALMIQRAISLENIMLVGSDQAKWGATPEERLANTITSVLSLAPYLDLSQEMDLYKSPLSVKSAACSDQRGFTIIEAQQALASLQIMQKPSNRQVSAIEYMSRPHIGFGAEYVPRHGPRPKIGGDGW
jgi:hypothetical protein